MKHHILLVMVIAAACIACSCGKKEDPADASGLPEGVVEFAMFERGMARAITSEEEDLLKKNINIAFEGTPIEQVMAKLSEAVGVPINLDPAVSKDTSFEYYNKQSAADLTVKWGKNPEENLKAKQTSFDFKETPLDEALASLSEDTKTTIVLDPFSLAVEGGKRVMPEITFKLDHTDLFTALTLIAGLRDMRVQPYENAAIITSAGPGTVTAIFDVRAYAADARELADLLTKAFAGAGITVDITACPGRLVMSASPNIVEAVPSFLKAQKKKADTEAAGAPLPRNINMGWQNQAFQTVMGDICRQAGLYYAYRDKAIQVSNTPFLITPKDQSPWIRKLVSQFDTPITKSFSGVTAMDIIKEISAQSGLTIEYELEAFMEMKESYPLNLYEVKAGIALDLLVLMAGLDYYTNSKEVKIYKPAGN